MDADGLTARGEVDGTVPATDRPSELVRQKTMRMIEDEVS
jgi:hypothetical protein